METWKKLISTLAGASLLLAVQTVSAQTQSVNDSETSWKALTNEPSRGDLFKQMAQAERPATGPQHFVFPYSFQFPGNTERDVDGTPRVNSRFGIDVSHHNGTNFPVALLKRQKVAFMYTKATQGTDFADKTFGERWEGMKKLPTSQRIPRGAYHFLASDKTMTGAAQADRFLAYVALHGTFEEGDLRPALDLEWDRACTTCPDRWAARTSADIVTTTKDFIARVKEKTGWTPMVYTNLVFLRDRGLSKAQIDDILASARVWIFDLSKNDRTLELADPAKNLPYVLWQFSWGGLLSAGYHGGLDVDSFKGTDEQFREAFLTKN